MALAAYASVDDYCAFWCMGPSGDLDATTLATIESMLLLSAAPLHMARAAVGVADGGISEEATLFFRYLNCLIAAVINHCPCGTARLDETAEKTWLYEIATGLSAIRSGELPLVAGETGSLFPYADYAQVDHNAFSVAHFLAASFARTW
jgi:hypothetical protein